ncbi:MAG: tail fiber protein [Pseudomonadota bacterium]
MPTPFIGEVLLFGGNFAPRGYAQCNGQLLSISQNTALFSLLGTTYGGDGQTTFALPDLRGRVSVHQGGPPIATPRVIGESFGSEPSASSGNVTGTLSVTRGLAVTTAAVPVDAGSNPLNRLAVQYVIALEGIFPSRN